MTKEEIVEKTEILISSWEKVRERDKTPGTTVKRRLAEATADWRQTEDEELDMIKSMYADSDLRSVASAAALELLWHWINEIRFDGKHADDLMLIARGNYSVPGQHRIQCMLLTELSSGIDVMAGAIRHELGKLWSIAADNVHGTFKE